MEILVYPWALHGYLIVPSFQGHCCVLQAMPSVRRNCCFLFHCTNTRHAANAFWLRVSATIYCQGPSLAVTLPPSSSLIRVRHTCSSSDLTINSWIPWRQVTTVTVSLLSFDNTGSQFKPNYFYPVAPSLTVYGLSIYLLQLVG